MKYRNRPAEKLRAMQRIARNKKMFAMVRLDMGHVLVGYALRTTEPRRWGDSPILCPPGARFKPSFG
jgi:hypothetical protein